MAKSGAEQDVVTGWRHVMCYLTRSGVKSGIKRQIRRRERHEARREIRGDREDR